ncbi:hypothetical protein LJC20_06730, partial [Eubacteriales bacterium OttesenSCG-928-M02]|nr:hypothetical protein [Eubacteriales bacterium OttesenSCG-928-M02]
MKTSKKYKIDYTKKVITITQSYAKQASVFGTMEYEEFKMLRDDHADFKIKLNSVSKKKNSHKKLTFEKMIAVIRKREDNDNLTLLQKAIDDKVPYPAIKKWFLQWYPDYNKINIEMQDAS